MLLASATSEGLDYTDYTYLEDWHMEPVSSKNTVTYRSVHQIESDKPQAPPLKFHPITRNLTRYYTDGGYKYPSGSTKQLHIQYGLCILLTLTMLTLNFPSTHASYVTQTAYNSLTPGDTTYTCTSYTLQNANIMIQRGSMSCYAPLTLAAQTSCYIAGGVNTNVLARLNCYGQTVQSAGPSILPYEIFGDTVTDSTFFMCAQVSVVNGGTCLFSNNQQNAFFPINNVVVTRFEAPQHVIVDNTVQVNQTNSLVNVHVANDLTVTAVIPGLVNVNLTDIPLIASGHVPYLDGIGAPVSMYAWKDAHTNHSLSAERNSRPYANTNRTVPLAPDFMHAATAFITAHADGVTRCTPILQLPDRKSVV